jgi:hypothetical protein
MKRVATGDRIKHAIRKRQLLGIGERTTQLFGRSRQRMSQHARGNIGNDHVAAHIRQSLCSETGAGAHIEHRPSRAYRSEFYREI